MTTITRTVRTQADAQQVFDYLLDFRNALEWDSGTVSCDLLSGDGGVGTTYRNVSTFMGRKAELTYTVEQVDAPHFFVIVGRNDTTTSEDTVVVRREREATAVDYTATFTFRGPARFVAPLLNPFLQRLGNATQATLQRALDRLSVR